MRVAAATPTLLLQQGHSMRGAEVTRARAAAAWQWQSHRPAKATHQQGWWGCQRREAGPSRMQVLVAAAEELVIVAL